MYCYYLFVTILFGLIFGSFISCAATRYSAGEDFIHGRSRCDHCGTPLTALDLIPVFSYLFSGGRCRHCKTKLSPLYPLSELLLALLWVGLYIRFQPSVEFLRYAAFTGVLFAIAIIDMIKLEIPTGTLIMGIAIWLVSLLFGHESARDLFLDVASAVVVLILFLALSLIMDHILGKTSLGGGDIKLFAVCALYLGPFGTYAMVLCSCIIGLLHVGITKSVKGSDFDGRIPFGPDIAVSAYLLFIFSDLLSSYYFSFFF